jgi:hypothetical protein
MLPTQTHTNKQAVRRGGDRQTANFDPQKTQKSLKFGINLKRSTQRQQQEPKAREKSQLLRENHDQMEAIKWQRTGAPPKGAVGDRGYGCGRLRWFENRGMLTVDCVGMDE